MREPPLTALRRAGRRHPFDAGFLLAALSSGLLFAWIGKGGFLLATRVGAREHYYTVAAQQLLHGKLWVPYKALTFECFEVHGRCYGYFGLAPTLFRLPVVALLGPAAKSNGVELAYFLLGFALAAAGTWWVTRQVVALWGPARGQATGQPHSARRSWWTGAVAGVALLGATPLVFLMGRPLVYEEAILWGDAFALVALGAALALWRRPRRGVLAALLLADLFGVLSRPTSGASAIFATGVLGLAFLVQARRRRSGSREPGPGGIPAVGRPAAWGLCLLLGGAVAMGSASVVAYAKFGSFSPPYRDQLLLIKYSPNRIPAFEHFAGINAAVLPTKLASTLDPASLIVLDRPPFVVFRELHPLVVWPARKTDFTWEPTASVTDTLPFDFLVTVAGLSMMAAAARRWRRLPRPRPADPTLAATVTVTVSALGALGLGLMFPGITYRYLGDWLPVFALCVALAMARFAAPSVPPGSPSTRRGCFVLVTVVAVVVLSAQLFVQTSFAVQSGLTSTGQFASVCHGPLNPYGVIGRLFCPGKYSDKL